MIELESVTKRYGSLVAVEDVSLAVPDGSIFGVIGKSGAGKSTLLRVMSLLERPDAGEVRYGGERVDTLIGAALLGQRRKMGMIFQNFNLFSSRNAANNIAYPLEIAGISHADREARVNELLELVQIADKKTARLRELSGGQKQRVAIARALAVNPETLYCDEATSALDPQTTRSILALIKDLQAKLGLTVVLVTHQMEVIRAICSHVAVLDSGRVVETGEVGRIFDAPQSKAAKEMLNVC
ncbi:MAG: ATP-binding cassette domain-containing protein [Spirochaetaceae bacterium]|nr:ATP-binding cassette domain-containing protein [Spirochaetaceae bacterium]